MSLTLIVVSSEWFREAAVSEAIASPPARRICCHFGYQHSTNGSKVIGSFFEPTTHWL
jgi:hypothetical protein